MFGLHFIILSMNFALVSSSKCSVLTHKKTKNGITRLTVIYKGNYTIQALLTLSSPESKCSSVSTEGLIRSYAMKYGIDKANNNNNITRWAKLGMQLDDVCRSLPVTMARGIEVVSLHRPNSVCRADFLKCDSLIEEHDIKEATAVIGTQMSFTSIPLASLMSLYYIPQISYAASSRLLSKKELYKSFFRTIPSDTNQISVMLDVFAIFHWNYVFAIGSDDDYGKLGVSDLKREALSRNVCISNDEYIPYQSSKTELRVEEVVEKIKAEHRAIVVVLFCYVENLGDLILKEAQKQGVKRIWLTSEAWNPDAATLSATLRNQTDGLLTVSLKSYTLDHFIDYMESEIKNDWGCNMWLRNYLNTSEFDCLPTGISSDSKTLLGKNCNVSIQDVVSKLRVMPGPIDNLIDAVTSAATAVNQLLEKQCNNASRCFIPKLNMRQLTEQMFNVSFINEQGMEVSFDDKGDPKFAFYTIENLQTINGTRQFVPVGNWSQKESIKERLKFDTELIKWPNWFAATVENSYPLSRCSRECTAGQFVVGRTGCCWGCQDCTGNNYTSKPMAQVCEKCGEYEHTDKKHTRCITTPILWLEFSDPAGMCITILSTLGMIIMVIACVILIQFRHRFTPDEPASYLITVSCVLLMLTFVFGPLHVIEPTYKLCQARNAIFSLLLMMYSAIVLIKSKFMTSYLNKHAETYFGGNLLIAQLSFLLMLFLVELVSVITWLYIDTIQVKEFRQAGVDGIWKQCDTSFTAARLVSTFIPCIVLIIATFCAFRERNLEHSFYEPKFLSFMCIALCIIVVAFLPTFKYVVGIYKAIVMAFTMDVFGYTFMACLVLPKVYVVLLRHRHGITDYPAKSGTGSKTKSEEVAMKTKTSLSSPVTDMVMETSIVSENLSDESISQKTTKKVVEKVDNEMAKKCNETTHVTANMSYAFVEDKDSCAKGHITML